MMKYTFGLLFIFIICASCKGQNQTNPPQDTISKGHSSEPQLKENSAGELAVSLAATSKVPVSMVRHVKQARNGDILIASYLGVFRYDGTSFTNLTNKISPPRSSSFWDVLEDRKGNLWFGTRDSGVYHYNGKFFQHFTTKDGLASNMALHFYEDRAGNIWLGASRYDPSTYFDSAQHKSLEAGGKSFRNLTTKDGFPSNSIRLLLEDKAGNLWFGAQGENMFVYDGKTFTVLKDKDGRAFNNVWSIIEDKKGNIWFGADGLWRYDPSAHFGSAQHKSLRAGGSTYTKVSQRGAYAIIQDKKGNIWTTGGVNPNGNVWALSRYDAKSLYNKIPTVTEIMSQSGMLLGILEDAKGNIWFGSGSGVYRYDGKTITDFKGAAENQVVQAKSNTQPIESGIGALRLKYTTGVRSILEDSKGNIWFGSHNEGVCLLHNGELQYFTTENGLSNNQVRSIYEDKNGIIWFECGIGLSTYDGKEMTIYKERNYNSKNGWKLTDSDLWFKGDETAGYNKLEGNPGVYQYDGKNLYYHTFPIKPKSGEENAYSISTPFVRSKNRMVWFGTYNALIRYDGKQFKMFNDDSLGLNGTTESLHIRSIMEDSKGNLWIGNNSGGSPVGGIGVIKYDGKAFIHFTKQHQLRKEDTKGNSLDRVFSIGEDASGNIWFGTVDSGVWRYDGHTMKNFTRKDGLDGDFTWIIYKSKTGELWFGGGPNGVYRFNGKSFERKY